MNHYLRAVLMFTGIAFLILGIIGLFLPILQGIIFIIIGIYILSLTSLTFKSWVDHHMGKYPRVKHVYDKHSGRVDKFFKKRGGQ